MVPELNGKPTVLTKNNSNLPANSTIPGIIIYIIMARISMESIPAVINPLYENLYFL